MKKAKVSIWLLQPVVSSRSPFAFFLLPFLTLPAQAAIDVWAIGECIRINPETGAELWTCRGLNPLVYTSPLYAEGVVVAMGGFMGSARRIRGHDRPDR